MQKTIVAGACLLAGALALVAPTPSFAQLQGTVNPFTVNLTPEYPTPNAIVNLSLSSSVLDLSNSTFKVDVNGKRVATGTGTEPVSFTAGNAGSTMYVLVNVSSNGQTYQKTLTIRPADVALVTEPLSSAPTTYPGMPTIAASGRVRVVAVPDFRTANGAVIKPSTLSYTWHIGDQTLDASSGIGKDSAVVPAPLMYRSEKVSVTVETQDSSRVASRSLTLTPVTPIVLIYQDNPLTGVEYDHALTSSATLSGSQNSFIAEPYGFSTSAAPTLTWYLNNSKAQTGASITVRPQGSGQGTASLSVSAVANDASYTNAGSSVSLSFGTTTSSGLFGL